jgi:hypothetical protein
MADQDQRRSSEGEKVEGKLEATLLVPFGKRLQDAALKFPIIFFR